MPPKKISRKRIPKTQENISFYDLIPDELKKEYHNPNYDNHGINIPFRAVIIGGSGSGKTVLALEIIHRFSGTFETIVVCCKSSAEPLYEYLEQKLGDQLLIFEGSENIPELKEFEEAGQTLIIFDDLVLDKDQSSIEEYFIRGRKVGGGISCIYISQSFFKIPKTIRSQINYIFLKRISLKKDLRLIFNEFSLGDDIDYLIHAYKIAISDPLGFLLISTEAPDEKKFRDGFGKYFHN